MPFDRLMPLPRLRAARPTVPLCLLLVACLGLPSGASASVSDIAKEISDLTGDTKIVIAQDRTHTETRIKSVTIDGCTLTYTIQQKITHKSETKSGSISGDIELDSVDADDFFAQDWAMNAENYREQSGGDPEDAAMFREACKSGCWYAHIEHAFLATDTRAEASKLAKALKKAAASCK